MIQIPRHNYFQIICSVYVKMNRHSCFSDLSIKQKVKDAIQFCSVYIRVEKREYTLFYAEVL